MVETAVRAPAGVLARLDGSGVPLLAARLVVGITFVVMGWHKWSDPVAFLKALREYDMFPPGQPWLMNATAAALPVAEMLCGALLLAGVAVRGASLFLLALMAAFTAAIALRAAALAAAGGAPLCDIAFDCGCGGGVVNACDKLAQNGALLVLCAVALASRSRRWCLRRNLLPADAGRPR
ncbi:MAG TPA: DoxX family protein [Planctomycetota bacterium]|nr:DoxX family protein [Planctomycetota bacterium]